MDRGFFMVGVVEPRNTLNIGTLVRAAHVFGATGVFAVGRRFPRDNEAVHDFDRHVPIFYFDDTDHFNSAMPENAEVVIVEMHEEARSLHNFAHPERAIYLLGSEYVGVLEPFFDLRETTHIVQIPTRATVSLNVAIAGSIVMADRIMKIEARKAQHQQHHHGFRGR